MELKYKNLQYIVFMSYNLFFNFFTIKNYFKLKKNLNSMKICYYMHKSVKLFYQNLMRHYKNLNITPSYIQITM